MSGSRPPAVALALLLLPGAIWATQRQIDSRPGAQYLHEERLAVWSGEALRKLFPGFEQILSDLYWLQAVQYYGGERAFNEGSHFPLLEPLIDITVSLDPRFVLGYRYGATFLAEPWPSGAGRPAAAAALLERGITQNPETWQLYWDLGTIRFLQTGDPDGAAAALLAGADLPGAPSWLRSLAGRVLTGSNRRQTARLIWQQLYAEHEGALKSNALVNLQYLDAADALDQLRERLADYRARNGTWPASLEVLQTRSPARLPGADPTGVPFDYNPSSGHVGIARASILWALQPESDP
jgi:hypothetical protein